MPERPLTPQEQSDLNRKALLKSLGLEAIGKKINEFGAFVTEAIESNPALKRTLESIGPGGIGQFPSDSLGIPPSVMIGALEEARAEAAADLGFTPAPDTPGGFTAPEAAVAPVPPAALDPTIAAFPMQGPGAVADALGALPSSIELPEIDITLPPPADFTGVPEDVAAMLTAERSEIDKLAARPLGGAGVLERLSTLLGAAALGASRRQGRGGDTGSQLAAAGGAFGLEAGRQSREQRELRRGREDELTKLRLELASREDVLTLQLERAEMLKANNEMDRSLAELRILEAQQRRVLAQEQVRANRVIETMKIQEQLEATGFGQGITFQTKAMSIAVSALDPPVRAAAGMAIMVAQGRIAPDERRASLEILAKQPAVDDVGIGIMHLEGLKTPMTVLQVHQALVDGLGVQMGKDPSEYLSEQVLNERFQVYVNDPFLNARLVQDHFRALSGGMPPSISPTAPVEEARGPVPDLGDIGMTLIPEELLPSPTTAAPRRPTTLSRTSAEGFDPAFPFAGIASRGVASQAPTAPFLEAVRRSVQAPRPPLPPLPPAASRVRPGVR